jgi:hypothetical protein
MVCLNQLESGACGCGDACGNAMAAAGCAEIIIPYDFNVFIYKCNIYLRLVAAMLSKKASSQQAQKKEGNKSGPRCSAMKAD